MLATLTALRIPVTKNVLMHAYDPVMETYAHATAANPVAFVRAH